MQIFVVQKIACKNFLFITEIPLDKGHTLVVLWIALSIPVLLILCGASFVLFKHFYKGRIEAGQEPLIE
jgi:hypothetical protein